MSTAGPARSSNAAHLSPSFVDATPVGESPAFTVGDASYSMTSGVSIDRSYTKYLTVWVHQADNGWRFLLDGGNARPAP